MTKISIKPTIQTLAVASFAATCGTSLATELVVSRIQPSASYVFQAPGSVEKAERTATLQDITAEMRSAGFPVSAIAEIARVERKTVYSWLEGGNTPHRRHVERMSAIHSAMTEAAGGTTKGVFRSWGIKGPDGYSLRDILTAGEVDYSDLRRKLREMSATIRKHADDGPAKVPFRSATPGNPALDNARVASNA